MLDWAFRRGGVWPELLGGRAGGAVSAEGARSARQLGPGAGEIGSPLGVARTLPRDGKARRGAHTGKSSPAQPAPATPVRLLRSIRRVLASLGVLGPSLRAN